MNLRYTCKQCKIMSKFQYGVSSVSRDSSDAYYSSDAYSMMHMSMGSFPIYAGQVSESRVIIDTGDGALVAG